jgi:hypothetical protein
MKNGFDEQKLGLKELVDKVMAHKEWYEQLKKNPAELSKIHKLQLDQEQIDALKKINYDSLDDVAQAFGELNT